MGLLRPTHYTVTDLIREFASGVIAIPEIQRDVVWDSDQIKLLLDSLQRGYPTGAIILWEPQERDKKVLYDMIRPERIQNHALKPPRYMLLDGQQRLSALASVLLDRKQLKSLLFELENDMPYLMADYANLPNEIEATDDPKTYKGNWVTVNEILRREFQRTQKFMQLSTAQQEALSTYADRILNYSFPVQIISDVPYREVAEMFARINSQGTALTGAEIHLAKIVPFWPGITAEFRKYRTELTSNFAYDVDINFLVRVIAVLQCNVPQIKKLSDGVATGKIKRPQLNKTWKSAKNSIKAVIGILRDDLGLDKSKFILSKNSLIPLIYFVSRKASVTAGERKLMCRYFLMTNLSSYFGSSGENVLKREINALISADTVGQGLKDIVSGASKQFNYWYRGGKLRPADVTGSPSRNGILLAMYIVMRKKGAKDFGLVNALGLDAISDVETQVHHIFPSNYMIEGPAYDHFIKKDYRPADLRGMVNDITNMTFLSAQKNIEIRDTPPNQYFENETSDANLKAHLIPTDKKLWHYAKYEKFMASRAALIAKEINKLL